MLVTILEKQLSSVPPALLRVCSERSSGSDSFPVNVHVPTAACTAPPRWPPWSLISSPGPDSLRCRHTPGPCSHWATPGTRPPHGLWFTSHCAKPYVFRDFHVSRPHFFLRSFLHNVLVLGGSLMTTLSYIGPSTLFPILSIPLLSFVFSSRCLVLKHRLYLFYRWPVSARLEHNLVRADVFGSFLHCFIPVQKCAIY